MADPTLLADGLTWPESPRWHDGRLWLSDVHTYRLLQIGADGASTRAVAVPGRPAGMGFMPDGRLLLATALDRRLVFVEADGALREAADLSSLVTSLLNDMVVDAQGRAYVGDTGFVFGSGEPERPGALLLFDERHGARIAATDVAFPNGMAIAPDGATLYLAETFGNRITAFEIVSDGRLANRRVHAALEGAPDGLCLDAEGHLWVPLLFKQEFQRIAPDGTIVERIAFARERAIACMLGGPDRRTLFLCVSALDDSDPKAPVRKGAVYTCHVPVAGAGLP